MILEFNKQENGWVSEFVVTADFNLHIEGVAEGNVRIYQRGSENGEYAYVRGGTPYPSFADVYDFDFSALVYPKFIKVVCATEPKSAKIITEGEITELKNQEKEITVEKNGKTTITPDDGFNALSKVVVKTAVPNGVSDEVLAAKDVNFYDYDGTLLHSYTWDEAMAMRSLPALPKQKGLICQEWNYTLEDIKEQNGKCDVGATYITDDGKTRLYITIAAKGRMDVPLYFSQTVARGVTIDWGDGSATETLSGTGNVNTTHHYEDIGDYVISLDVAEGCELGLGNGYSTSVIGRGDASTENAYVSMLYKVEIGDRFNNTLSYSFKTCRNLRTITVPKALTSLQYAFYDCNNLSFVVIPQGTITISESAFRNCKGLKSVILPESVTSIGNYVFAYSSLSRICIPCNVVTLGDNCFVECYSLTELKLPNNVSVIPSRYLLSCDSLNALFLGSNIVAIESQSIQNCKSLTSVVIPQGVTSIGSNAFQYCYGMAFYDFRTHESVPTLANTNAFNNIPYDCKIVVPDALYDEWIAATNWSTYASYIVKASGYNA